MTRSIGILCTESRSECVDCTQSRCAQFTFELTRNGQTSRLTEEIIRIVDVTFLVLLQIIEILCGDLEHLSCTFSITRSDDGSVEVEVAVFVEIAVNCHCHVVANTENSTKSVGTQTKMRVLAHIFKRLSLLLHGIFASTSTEHFNGGSLYFSCLSTTLASNECTFDTQAGTSSN